jgi:hypothetical protein
MATKIVLLALAAMVPIGGMWSVITEVIAEVCWRILISTTSKSPEYSFLLGWLLNPAWILLAYELWKVFSDWEPSLRKTRWNRENFIGVWDDDFKPESEVIGSPISNRATTDRPKCSTVVYRNGKPAGDALRIGENLVLPFHLIAEVDQFEIVCPKNGHIVVIDCYDNKTDQPHFSEIYPDVVKFQLTPKEWAQIGMEAARVGDPMDGSILTAHSACKSASSFGKVTRDPKNPATLMYAGSTVPGFSGCGYFSGKTLMGIHLCGGGPKFNWGVSAGLIRVLAEGKEEESPDGVAILRKMYANGKIKNFTLVDDDQMGVFDGRNWKVFTVEDFDEAYAEMPEWKDSLDEVWDRVDRMMDYRSRGGRVPEGDFDALDVERTTYRDPPTLDDLPTRTPATKSSKLKVGPVNPKLPVQGNLKAGVLRAAEPPRVVTKEAEERIQHRERALKAVADLSSKRLTLAEEYQNNCMTLAGLSLDSPLWEPLNKKQLKLQSSLSETNQKLKVANVEAEKLKELTSGERKKKKKKRVSPLGKAMQEINERISSLRRQLKVTPLNSQKKLTDELADLRMRAAAMHSQRKSESSADSASECSHTWAEDVL